MVTKSVKDKQNKYGFMFIAVSTVLISLLVFYPMIRAFITSLYSGTVNNMKFVGLGNYRKMIHDVTFKNAAKNTFLYLAVQVPIMIFLALIVSVILNDKKLKFKGFYRTAIFLPAITSLVSYSIIMKSLFSQNGFVNQLLMKLNILNTPIEWINHPVWAKVLIIIAITWRWTGYNMIFFLSGLQNIEPSIYEAAEIDGASKTKQFLKITIPMLKPIILFTTITSTIGTLQLFDEVANITGGGPANATMTLSQYIYNLSYKFTPNFGYATAVSFVIVISIVVLSFIQMMIGGEKNDA